MIELLCMLFLAGVAWGCGYFVRGIVEADRRDRRRLAEWERKWLR